ncbi:MAG: hypothetical protein H0V01_10275 [Bacteroidetes bacterium]|nr:hypothetical protein [Bacteroidota bacterium]HET6246047.1 hypothetical protein [Bacteroidia bacterium]
MNYIIQKVVSSTSSAQLDFFEEFLKNKNHSLPLKLIKTIRKNKDDSSLFYASKIYGNKNEDTLKRLNQLAHHTFKLSAYLIQHFPNFLYDSLTQIDNLLFENKRQEVINKIKIVIEVGEKIEDYGFLVKLHDLVNQHFPTHSKTFSKTCFYDHVTNYNTLLTLIQKQDELVKHAINSSIQKKIKPNELVYFKSFFTNKSQSVQLIAKQSYLNVLSCFNHKEFYEKSTLELIKSTARELEKHPYLLITKYKDKILSLDYMLLKYTRLEMDEKEVNAACSKIISKWGTTTSTDANINAALFIAISIQGSYLLTNYYFNKITDPVIAKISETSELCNSLLNNVDWEKEGYLKHINLCNIYALFLILAGQQTKAIKLIEKILHEYQQKSFKKLYDGLFVALIMAYIMAKDYQGAINTYNRYKKITKEEVGILENDLVIRALYYISQIKEQQKPQYQNKLNAVMSELKKDSKLLKNYHLVKRVQSTLL